MLYEGEPKTSEHPARSGTKALHYDLGIRNSILNDFSPLNKRPDNGVLLETYAFLTLHEYIKPNMELRFWRTRQGDEVDFILLKNRIPHPIEVKFNLDRCEVTSGMKKFLSAYPKAPAGYVISRNFSGSAEFGKRQIRFIPWDRIEGLDILNNQ